MHSHKNTAGVNWQKMHTGFRGLRCKTTALDRLYKASLKDERLEATDWKFELQVMATPFFGLGTLWSW